MLIQLWILGISTAVASSELTGDNICEVEESYPVNVTEFSLKNATVRNYRWCMGFPPRCSFYTYKTVRVPNIVEKNETRIVSRCCSGFAENSRQDGCVSCKKCFYGFCGNEGKCICNAGFKGNECSEACELMRWGIDCQFECLCERGNCNPRTGQCDCPSGWFGTRCEISCLEGFYGKHCIHRCSCGERELCSSQTGQCSTKSTHRQQHQSTRAIHYLTEDILNFTKIIDRKKSTPSLKKYHTFDSELSTNTPILPRIKEESTHRISTNRKEKWKPYISSTPQLKISTPNVSNKSWSNTNRNFDKTHRRKNVNHNASTIKEKDDYVESTTEISAEIAHNEDSLPILNENESLERKYLNESLEHKDSAEKINEIKQVKHVPEDIPNISIVFPIDITNKKSSNTSNKKKYDESLKVMQMTVSPSNTEQLQKILMEKVDQKNLSKPLMNTQQNILNSNLNQINSRKSKNPLQNSTTRDVVKKTDVQVVNNGNENENNIAMNSRQENITNLSVLLKGPSKTKSSKKITSKPENSNQRISKLKNSTPMTYIQKITSTSTIHNTNIVENVSKKEETISKVLTSMNAAITSQPPQSYVSNSGVQRETTTMRTFEENAINISPGLQSTSPISENEKPSIKNGNQNIEEYDLQNLDTMAILTSRDTSTAASTKQDSMTSERDGILPFTDESSSIEPANSFSIFGNELLTTTSAQMRTPFKNAFDYRQNKEDNNYLSDEASGEFDYSSSDKNNLVTHVSIAVLVSFILVMIMASMILVHYYTRRRRTQTPKMRSEHHQNYPGGPTVSVYTHSIFHTPLPG